MASRQTYLFDSLGSKTPRSSRKVHIRRLVDVLQLSIHRRDWPRARRAWCILAQCKEFDWKRMWRTGLLLTNCKDAGAEPHEGDSSKRLEYLRAMMLQAPEYNVSILQEITLWLIKSNRHQEALEEIELYLPSLPYQDDPVLHIYAGFVCLFLAYPADLRGEESLEDDQEQACGGAVQLDQTYVLQCKTHFRRATELDPDNPIPHEYLLKLGDLETREEEAGSESDDADGTDSKMEDDQEI